MNHLNVRNLSGLSNGYFDSLDVAGNIIQYGAAFNTNEDISGYTILGQPSSYFTGLTSNIQNQINNASATTYQNTFNNSTLTNDLFFYGDNGTLTISDSISGIINVNYQNNILNVNYQNNIYNTYLTVSNSISGILTYRGAWTPLDQITLSSVIPDSFTTISAQTISGVLIPAYTYQNYYVYYVQIPHPYFLNDVVRYVQTGGINGTSYWCIYQDSISGVFTDPSTISGRLNWAILAQDGAQGVKGDKGDVGLTGAKGDVGLTGAKGDVGLTGAAGTGSYDDTYIRLYQTS